MLSKKLIEKTIEYFEKYSNEEYVVRPSLPILYFGDLSAYENSEFKILTVGKNPSDNEFRIRKTDEFSFCRFQLWNSEKRNLLEALNPYFEDKPLKQWFSSFEPILNGANSSFYKTENSNRALHTDMCSPLATNPTWGILTSKQQEKLSEEGFEIWKELIEELQPDLMLISVPRNLFKSIIKNNGTTLIKFDTKKDGSIRKYDYIVEVYEHKLRNGKNIKIIFGQAANKPFDTISIEQKIKIGKLCRK
jgi:hypothetical protein